MPGTVLGLLLAGCIDTSVSQLFPELTVTPEALDFGEVVVDYTATLPITLVNTGDTELNIRSVGFQDGSVFSVGPWPEVLEVDEQAQVEVSFTPPTYLDYSDVLLIETDDPDELENGPHQVPVSGVGGDGPTPDIEVEPTTLDFGAVAPGDTVLQYFTIDNVGDGTLEITDFRQEGSGAFTVTPLPVGHVIEPGATVDTIVVTYQPVNADGDNATLTLSSNDPDEPEVTVQLLGNGGGDFAWPVAVIEGPDEVAPPTTVYLDGSGSYDPSGHAITAWTWRLSSFPDGSKGILQPELSTDTTLTADVAGDYWVELQVQNDLGVLSAPAYHLVQAIPDDRIHIELSWNTNYTDLDLHLSEGTDVPLFQMPGDCNYCNPNPNWGDGGSDQDDPTLQLDDIQGYGPENIVIPDPADGEYLVRVHYFEDNGGGPTTATVRIYLDQVLQGTWTQQLERNDVWTLGYVRWRNGGKDAVVVELDEPVEPATERSCTF